MLIVASAAFDRTIGLIFTFGGIGVVVNAIIIYIAIQVKGEHRENREYLESRRPPNV
ncbi:MAG: hypothetical protein ACRDJX_04780 [Solirubrobacteraceae bacterium]